ncbi:MAG: FMN-binding protein [Actinomycetia bacterium]|nr:FMN-binding protein [Actinomycetes bacterium]
MRRAIPVLAATAGGIALLANFQTTPEHLATGIVATTSTTAPPTPSSGQPATSATPGPSTAPPTSAASASRTVDGPDVVTRYGDVQVRITVQGSRIEDVEALTLPTDRRRSAEISQYAGPRLRQEALQAQSANIDVVSGASYTSEGYARSLQGAIDASH